MFAQQFQFLNQQIIYKLPDYIPNLNLELNSPEIHYPKPKPPVVRKDPVLDAPEEISKWLEQRRKRYPKKNKPIIDESAQEFSILEHKLRKKISILSGSSRRTQIKVKQMKELCRVLTDTKRIRHKEQEEVSENSESEQQDQNEEKKFEDKDEILKEIARLQKKISENRPKEYYKKTREGHETKQLSKTDKQLIKKKIKGLKLQLKQLHPDLEQVVPPKAPETQPEDHTKDMIENLEDQKEKMETLLEESLNYKINPANFRYKSNTLYTNLLIGEIYKERQYLLQAIRYIVKENFFAEKPEQEFECITSESEEIESSEESIEDECF